MADITSNGRPIPFTDRYFTPARDSSDLLADPASLRERYQEDGFVWLRGVLRPGDVRRLRARYFAGFAPGYLAAGTRAEDGVFSGRRPGDLPPHGVEGHPAHAFVRSSTFLDFVDDPALTRVAEALLGGPCTQLPRRILRHFDRAAPTASRAHADYRYLDQGSDRLITIWIPLGDCPLPTGGLIYLAGSHRIAPERLAGLRARSDRPDDTRAFSHDLAWVSDQLGCPWSWADYAAGDVTVHSPYTVHASLDTRTDAMRASVDVRYLADGAAVDPRWLEPWAGDDGN
ncbi:MAG TPA: phytanoyl-CoA dioxygenase family protein [Acidimicrobiales bacterium]|jgi:ectoine hydroxylase-related dioxygenase (phytanoyl-CoA dioxygenase family)|nr:phytanoyl-CoA dioxygenase family protein [Acidimicrobiales bacterium]